MTIQLSQSVVLITGAASGIGEALAINLAKRGSHLALTDRNAEGLARVAENARSHGVTVSEHVFDMEDTARIQALPGEVTALHHKVNVVINNAGIAAIGRFNEVDSETFEKVININYWAPVHLTRAFLPLLQQQSSGHLVYLSSIFGIIAPSGQAAYCSSKFAIRGFSEVLRHELADTSVAVSTVHPGGIKTNIATSAIRHEGLGDQAARELASRFDDMAPTTAEQAAELIVQGILTKQARILIGADARFLERLSRLLPVKYWSIIQSKFAPQH